MTAGGQQYPPYGGQPAYGAPPAGKLLTHNSSILNQVVAAGVAHLKCRQAPTQQATL
jgi:hypothetical protein